jgi:hypothetical protein
MVIPLVSYVGQAFSLTIFESQALAGYKPALQYLDQHFVHLPLALLDSITLFTKRMPNNPSREFGK